MFFFYFCLYSVFFFFFFFQAEDGIRDHCVTGVQTCALPILAEERAVKRVRPRARDDVDLRAGRAAVLRLDVLGAYRHLLYGRGRGDAVGPAACDESGGRARRESARASADGRDVDVNAHPVEHKAVRVRALAVEGEVVAPARARRGGRARRERGEREGAPTVERQFPDGARLDGRTEGGGGRVHHRRPRRDGDHLLYAADPALPRRVLRGL